MLRGAGIKLSFWHSDAESWQEIPCRLASKPSRTDKLPLPGNPDAILMMLPQVQDRLVTIKSDSKADELLHLEVLGANVALDQNCIVDRSLMPVAWQYLRAGDHCSSIGQEWLQPRSSWACC